MITNKHYETIQHWGPIEEVYNEALKTAKDGDVFVEVGIWLGHSLCYLGAKAKDLDLEIKVYGVDVFCGENMYKEIDSLQMTPEKQRQILDENLEKQGITDMVTIIPGLSWEVAEQFANNSVHCVYIDGDHSYVGVTKDLEAYYPKVKVGGIVGGHDWENTNAEVKQAVRDFARVLFGDEWEKQIVITKEQWPSWYFIKPE